MNLTIQTSMLPFANVIEELSVLTKGEHNFFDRIYDKTADIVYLQSSIKILSGIL